MLSSSDREGFFGDSKGLHHGLRLGLLPGISSEIHFVGNSYKFHFQISHNVRLLRFHLAILMIHASAMATIPERAQSANGSRRFARPALRWNLKTENSFKQLALPVWQTVACKTSTLKGKPVLGSFFFIWKLLGFFFAPQISDRRQTTWHWNRRAYWLLLSLISSDSNWKLLTLLVLFMVCSRDSFVVYFPALG